MPASSEAQRRAAGAALSAKREGSASNLGGASKDMHESMTEDELEDFASKSISSEDALVKAIDIYLKQGVSPLSVPPEKRFYNTQGTHTGPRGGKFSIIGTEVDPEGNRITPATTPAAGGPSGPHDISSLPSLPKGPYGGGDPYSGEESSGMSAPPMPAGPYGGGESSGLSDPSGPVPLLERDAPRNEFGHQIGKLRAGKVSFKDDRERRRQRLWRVKLVHRLEANKPLPEGDRKFESPQSAWDSLAIAERYGQDMTYRSRNIGQSGGDKPGEGWGFKGGQPGMKYQGNPDLKLTPLDMAQRAANYVDYLDRGATKQFGEGWRKKFEADPKDFTDEHRIRKSRSVAYPEAAVISTLDKYLIRGRL